jgi:hypothetical protein
MRKSPYKGRTSWSASGWSVFAGKRLMRPTRRRKIEQRKQLQALGMKSRAKMHPTQTNLHPALPLVICFDQSPRLRNGGIRAREKLVRLIQRIWHVAQLPRIDRVSNACLNGNLQQPRIYSLDGPVVGNDGCWKRRA